MYYKIAMICLILVSSNLHSIQKSPTTSQATTKKDPIATIVSKIVKDFMREFNIPGAAVALYIHGTPYLFSFGYADQEHKIPVTESTLFEIGSISKLFTCLLIAQEILAGRMRLTDPITNYIPLLATNNKLQTCTLE